MTDKKEVDLEKTTELSDEELEKVDGGVVFPAGHKPTYGKEYNPEQSKSDTVIRKVEGGWWIMGSTKK